MIGKKKIKPICIVLWGSKEFNEIVNASMIIQNQMQDCETIEELYHMFESWQTLVKNMYLKRIKDLTDK